MVNWKSQLQHPTHLYTGNVSLTPVCDWTEISANSLSNYMMGLDGVQWAIARGVGDARNRDIYTSVDNGYTWSYVLRTPLRAALTGSEQWYILSDGSFLFMGTWRMGYPPYDDQEILHSVDGGASWHLHGSGWGGAPVTSSAHMSFITSDDVIILASSTDIWVTFDLGVTWDTIDAPWPTRINYTLCDMGNGRIMMYGGYNGVLLNYYDMWISDYYGLGWSEVTKDLPDMQKWWPGLLYNRFDSSLHMFGGFEQSDHGTNQVTHWRSVDEGEHWVAYDVFPSIASTAGWCTYCKIDPTTGVLYAYIQQLGHIYAYNFV